MITKAQLEEYNKLAYDIGNTSTSFYPCYDMGAAAKKAVPVLVAEVRQLQADNADLRRQVRDLEELLRREEARP